MAIHAAEFRELRLDRLSRAFGSVNALRDVTHIIAGLLPATGGGIWLDERRIDNLRPEERGFGMVFQNYALFPHMSVRKNVGFGLMMCSVAKAEAQRRINEAIALV